MQVNDRGPFQRFPVTFATHLSRLLLLLRDFPNSRPLAERRRALEVGATQRAPLSQVIDQFALPIQSAIRPVRSAMGRYRDGSSPHGNWN